MNAQLKAKFVPKKKTDILAETGVFVYFPFLTPKGQ